MTSGADPAAQEPGAGPAMLERYSLHPESCPQRFLESDLIQVLEGKQFNVTHLQKRGFHRPVLVSDKADLDLKVPSGKPEFSLAEIRAAVGSRRPLLVRDSLDPTSAGLSLSMKEWQKFVEDPQRDTRRLYVDGLEFSLTKLDAQVVAPKIVREIDWVERAWPPYFKSLQFEATNALEEMMYPKVQKYCWMSVAHAFQDFQIERGGASTWNHGLKGRLVIWLIPPSDEHLKLYETMLPGGFQTDFLPDQVTQCCRFELTPGSTLFIPAGWIHAIYSAQDCIAFRGKFLHSFGIEKQLQSAYMEEMARIAPERRFPFYVELLWYVLDRYVHCVLGRTRLDLPEEEKRRIRLEKGDNVDPNEEVFRLSAVQISDSAHPVHLTTLELHGLKYIIMFLHQLPNHKKNVPLMLPDPIGIIKDVRELVVNHNEDCPEAAVTGRYIINWGAQGKKGRKTVSKQALLDLKNHRKVLSDTSKRFQKNITSSGNSRRRRVRCKTCEACVGGDCKSCVYCKDMVKYGGPGRMKQTCEKRRCLHPQLPVCAYCSVCLLDGWFNEPKLQSKESERPSSEEPPNLFECTVCLDIVHPECANKTAGKGLVNPDLSNSWECAKCSQTGFSQAPSRTTPGSSGTKKRPIHEVEFEDEDEGSSLPSDGRGGKVPEYLP